MKTQCALLVMALLFSACGKKKEASREEIPKTKTGKPPSKLTPKTADGKGGSGSAKSEGGGTPATVDADAPFITRKTLPALNEVVAMYGVDRMGPGAKKTKIPRDLEQLVKERFLTRMPVAQPGHKLIINQTTGLVELVDDR